MSAGPGTSPQVEVHILGPVAATVAGVPVRLGPQLRALLGVLAVEADRVLPAHRLVDLLWGEPAPPAASSTLRSHVQHLRRVLEPGRRRGDPPRVVVTEAGGYTLRISPEQIDATRFERLVAAGQRALSAGRPDEAGDRLRAALALHRGPVLACVADRPFARPTVARFEALREAAVLARVEADLAVGTHREVVGEIAGLLAGDPLNEPLRRMLVIALHRCDKAEEAARACRDGLALFHAHGLDPDGLRDLQHRLLREPATLDWRPSRALRPFQLPPDVPEFTGRAGTVGDLGSRLAAGAAGSTAGGAVILAVDGPPGIGKSALATHVAHRHAERFPDGVLYVDLRGAGAEPMDPVAVLGQFVRSLDPATPLPADLDTVTGTYRSLLASRRVLVVLDNAATAEQVRPLLPTSPGCAALLTSRSRLADLDGAVPVPLDRLPGHAAVTLLGTFAGDGRVAADPAATAAVIGWCGGLPLALRIAGARLRSRPSWSMRDLADRLADSGRRLDELAVGDLAVRTSFQISYRAVGPARQRALRLLGLLGGPDFTAEIAAALTGAQLPDVRAALEYCVDAQLIESIAADRYRFHDLMRLFARELAGIEEPAAERTAALRRAFTWYLAGAAQAYPLLALPNHPPPGVPNCHPPAPRFADRAHAQAWLATEHANLVSAVRSAAAHPDRSVAELAWLLDKALRHHFQWRAPVTEWAAVCRASAAAARRFAEPAAEASALNRLGITSRRAGRPREAIEHFTRSLELCRQAGHERTGVLLNNIGNAYFDLGQYGPALDHYRRALACARDAQRQQVPREDGAPGRGARHIEDEAIALECLGMAHLATGETAQAIDCLERSLAISVEMADRSGQAETLASLGRAYLDRCEYDTAVEYLERSLAMGREFGYRLNEAEALWTLGRVRLATGGMAAAREPLTTALEIFTSLGAGQAGAVRALLLGHPDPGPGRPTRRLSEWHDD